MSTLVKISANDENVLLERVKSLLEASASRIIISVAGLPGSGKSFWTAKIIASLNEQGIESIAVPQDGFHLYRRELDLLPNPEEAHTRRGAPFTFNAKAFLELTKKLKTTPTLRAPSFDHSLKDPTENDILITEDTQVVILEGNYVSLRDEIWNEISDHVDDTWFIETPLDTIRDRLIKRHLDLGIASSLEEAINRADGSDLTNAKYILKHSKPTNVVIAYS